MQLTEIFSNSLRLMIDKFVLGIPNLIMAIVVCLIGIFIAKTVAKMLKLFIAQLGIDKYGEKLNEIEFVYKSGMKIKISEILSKCIYYMLLLLFIVVSTDILQMPALSNLVSSAIEFFPNLIVALIVLVLGLLGADALRKAVLTACNSLGIPSAKVISVFVFYFVFITVFIMALSQAKINTAFLAQNISIILGGAVFAFSLGYGLASKDIVSNFLASMYSKDRVKIGDNVKFNGIEGKVIDVDKSAITIATQTSKIVVPINKMLTDNIEILN
jgi:small-conductance mechanosensitive channel